MRPRLRLPSRHALFAVTITVVGVAAYYDLAINPGFTIGTWLASPLDWLFAGANVVLLYYGVWPVLADPMTSHRTWQRFRDDRLALAGVAWLAAFYLIGTIGYVLLPEPSLNFLHDNQPPVYTTIDANHVSSCVGPVVDGACHGTWTYPLGTDLNGYAMELLIVQGLHVTLYVAVISLALIVPLALIVGTIAGYLDGWPDLAAMRAVEVQDAVPPLVVYLLVIFITGESLLVILLLFGFLGWGAAARVVRSESRQLRTSEYVTASTALGAHPRHVLTTHVLPAVASVAIPIATQQIPILLLTEAGLAFLGLEAFDLQSLGNIIARGTFRGDVPMQAKWWVSGLSVTALALTVTAFKIVGDTLVESLDPRLD